MSKPSSISQYEAYLKLHAGKKPVVEMSVDLGIDRSTIKRFAHQLGLSLRLTANIENQQWVDQQILAHYHDHTIVDMRKLTGVGRHKLNYRAAKLGVSFKPLPEKKSRKQKREEGFFNEMERDWFL